MATRVNMLKIDGVERFFVKAACRRCYGRGYIGRTQDGKLLLCRCLVPVPRAPASASKTATAKEEVKSE